MAEPPPPEPPPPPPPGLSWDQGDRFSGRVSDIRRNFSFIPDNIPARHRKELISEFEELEAWIALNAKAARRNSLRFWVLKIPAILATSCAGVFGYFNLQAATVVSGAIGSICVLIDGLNPGGTLRNIHIRAVHDLRQLQDDVKAKLRYGIPGQDSLEGILGSIFGLVQSERRRIGAYLREAESVFGEAKR
jgi:hypothetical protein